MELKVVRIEKPAEVNFILGQSHFIKTGRISMRRWWARCQAYASAWPFVNPPGNA